MVPLRPMVVRLVPVGAIRSRPRGRGALGGLAGWAGGSSCGGLGAWATSVASHAWAGVARPGRLWWGRSVSCGCGRRCLACARGLGDGGGQGLLVQPAQQGGGGSARSCAVGGGLVGLAGDGLHAQRSDVIHQPALPAPAGGVQRGPVVGQEPLGHAVGAHALVEDPDGRVTGLGPGDQGGHRQAGVIVLKLEDHALAASLQDVLSGVQLPAGVRKRGRRTASRPLGASSWARRGPASLARKIRARDATEGASRPMETILSWTLTGPWSRPESSRDARTATAWSAVASLRRVGLVRGRRDLGSSTAACPSARARALRA